MSSSGSSSWIRYSLGRNRGELTLSVEKRDGETYIAFDRQPTECSCGQPRGDYLRLRPEELSTALETLAGLGIRFTVTAEREA